MHFSKATSVHLSGIFVCLFDPWHRSDKLVALHLARSSCSALSDARLGWAFKHLP